MWRNDDDRWYGREELFDLIWSKPVRQLAKEFGTHPVSIITDAKSINGCEASAR